MITVEKVNQTTFKVTVKANTTTTHHVTVDPAYYEKLTDGNIPAELLVEKSFEFLLDRESNTSILRTFNLRDINRYFREYEKTITHMI